MTLDRAVLAERVMAVERHLRRVVERLPPSAQDLQPSTYASDAVILHLWQATQIVIDLAMSACLFLALGTPSSYADAFSRTCAGRTNAGVVKTGWCVAGATGDVSGLTSASASSRLHRDVVVSDEWQCFPLARSPTRQIAN